MAKRGNPFLKEFTDKEQESGRSRYKEIKGPA